MNAHVARFGVALFLLAASNSVARAVQPDEIMGDPALEARARTLSRELRCMVCQNQSIDDSDAPLARDLRLLVRERLAAGDSDARVLDFLVSRYGQFVLLKPRFDSRTLLLWLTTPVLLLLGVVALIVRRRSYPVQMPLSAEDQQQLQRLAGQAGSVPADITKN